MQEWLVNPAIQAGVVPFLLTFVIAAAFKSLGRINSLSVIAGFIVAVWLTTGISFDPLTSTRKIVLLALLSPLLGLFLTYFQVSGKIKNTLLVTSAVAAVLWVIWPVLIRKELAEALIYGVGFSVFSLLTVLLFNDAGRESRVKVSVGLCAFAFGVGGAATFGASTSLGQWGISLGVSMGALILSMLLMGNTGGKGDSLLTFTTSLVVSLIAVAATVYAKVPWYVLVCFPVVAIMLKYLPVSLKNNWLNATVWFVVTLIPSGLAVYLTLQSQGPLPF